MSTLNGVHHLAIMTADVKSQIEFFSDVLGMKLKALYWMHNVEGYFHAFMELNPSCSVAFVYAPSVQDIPTEFGVSHAGNPVKPCAPGVMQHLAFNCDTDAELVAMRDRINCAARLRNSSMQSETTWTPYRSIISAKRRSPTVSAPI